MGGTPLDNFHTAETVLLVLKEQFADADPAWYCDAEQVSALVQGLELTLLLMRDAGRRLQGCPPAALDAAVYSFLDRMAELRRQPRHPLVGVSHLTH